MNPMKVGFEMRKIRLPLSVILPVRQVENPQKHVSRYSTILASIKEVGIVEPLVVHPQKDGSGKYLLLDGHLRYFALKEIGQNEVDCIIANDDESFTYNARINRLSSIQEHKMILKAVQNGVKPERIAVALNITVNHVRSSMKLLDGINEEASDLLKDKGISPKALRLLRRVSAIRQIEIAELMVSANNFTSCYAEALLMGTPKDQLTQPDEPKRKAGLTPEEIARMEQEMETMERDFRAVEDGYGENMLNLTLGMGYIKKLLNNARVVRFLNTNHPDILSEFESMAAAETV